MAGMTHSEACAALQANATAYTAGHITRNEWDREVERVLDLRFPSATSPPTVQAGALNELSHAMSTSTPPDTLRPAPGRNLARAGDLADAPGGP